MRCIRSSVLFLVLIMFLIPFGGVFAADGAQETVCLQCHAGQPDELGAPVHDWPGSVHERNGISCHDCHGGDPTDFALAMDPSKGFVGVPEYEEVPEFCGKCHVGVLEDYLKSAHGQKVSEGGAQCVMCHGSHAVQEAEIGLINEEDCSRCHEYGRAAEIKFALKDTDALITQIDSELERVRKLGFATEEMAGGLFDLRNRFHRVFHTVDVDLVRKETDEFQTELKAISAKIGDIDTEVGQRTLWGSVVIGLFVLLGVIFLLMRKTYEEEE